MSSSAQIQMFAICSVIGVITLISMWYKNNTKNGQKDTLKMSNSEKDKRKIAIETPMESSFIESKENVVELKNLNVLEKLARNPMKHLAPVSNYLRIINIF